MPLQPGLDLLVLVRRVVVHDQVEVQIGRCFPVHEVEKPDPFLMAVLFNTSRYGSPFGHAFRGEKGGRAVS